MEQDKYRTQLEQIALAAIQAVSPFELVRKNLDIKNDFLTAGRGKDSISCNLKHYKKIFLLAIGKAAASMAKAAESVLGERITQGLVITKYGHTEKLRICRTIEAGHPVPDNNSLRAGEAALELARRADDKTLFISLISGGGSSLMCLPYRDDKTIISLKDKKSTTDLLLSCGASISEINTIRKHISLIKGGRLAEEIFPACGIHLILSDVIRDRLDVIASGPTVPDSSSFFDAWQIIKKYKLEDKIPSSVKELILSGTKAKSPDTPDKSAQCFSKNKTFIIGNNRLALDAAKKRAEELGYKSTILSYTVEGEARDIAKSYIKTAHQILETKNPLPPPCCVLAGGEPTVTIRGKGKGGRNQELSLAFLNGLKNPVISCDRIHFLSAATDGNDGPTDAAGAFASAQILKEAEKSGLDIQRYLDDNDSYNFFSKIDALYKTGPTNTNVCDLHILIIS